MVKHTGSEGVTLREAQVGSKFRLTVCLHCSRASFWGMVERFCLGLCWQRFFFVCGDAGV